ncbi:MAG TPA: hypothetical protein VE690_15405 [Rhodopila sp.]|nr:hypothetical protein [Rhodopila sp.]
MTQIIGSVTVEERQAGDTTWVAVRARGADWSWLTRDDALRLARHLIETYGEDTEADGMASWIAAAQPPRSAHAGIAW